jgi:type II secretory pathway pseudopilin PulG
MKTKYWFTFIEVMIAIVVFSIGVLAVLWLVTTNLKTVDKNDMYLQATVFAKEWLELTYNLKDSNLEKDLPWNCILKDSIFSTLQEDLSNSSSDRDRRDELYQICWWYFGVGSSIVVSYPISADRYIYASTINLTWDFDNTFNLTKIYQSTWDYVWYSNQKWGSSVDTSFARYISFTWVVENWIILDTEKILKIESHVLWKKWNSTWEVVIESFIWNY